MSTVRGAAKQGHARRLAERAGGDSVDAWARRHFAAKYGEVAARAAAVCRREGLRDLVMPLELVAESIPTLAHKVTGGVKCTHGTTRVIAPRTSYKTGTCGAMATCLVITDSGLVSFYCGAHAETAVVRMPGK